MHLTLYKRKLMHRISSSEHPQLIVIHTGTNDLTPTTPADEFVSNISVFITQASTMFPKSKIIFSTLLPRADIPLNTVSNINMKLIDSCSTLPNVHLVRHDDIFSKGLDILYDKNTPEKATHWYVCSRSSGSDPWPT